MSRLHSGLQAGTAPTTEDLSVPCPAEKKASQGRKQETPGLEADVSVGERATLLQPLRSFEGKSHDAWMTPHPTPVVFSLAVSSELASRAQLADQPAQRRNGATVGVIFRGEAGTRNALSELPGLVWL